MSEKYRGRIDDRRYTSDAVDVTYNLVRCIHAAECVRRLGEVFDTSKRPWIQPANSAADSIVYTVAHCPSGALHTERNDGGKGEEIPTENIIVVHNDSYYEFKGDIEIQGSNVAIEQEIRAALCR
ncbi:MAG: (4Fe-4S)-binding protein, partial [Candidatus Promineifilaceae bacterium]|nr:(4Fe-4S)-binding protein [Candidatus Promineifilaceae bacterium]